MVRLVSGPNLYFLILIECSKLVVLVALTSCSSYVPLLGTVVVTFTLSVLLPFRFRISFQHAINLPESSRLFDESEVS